MNTRIQLVSCGLLAIALLSIGPAILHADQACGTTDTGQTIPDNSTSVGAGTTKPDAKADAISNTIPSCDSCCDQDYTFHEGVGTTYEYTRVPGLVDPPTPGWWWCDMVMCGCTYDSTCSQC
jgi:hypothetical protein